MKYKNPYLPLWEHIPDGEARVFDDPNNPGKQRLYIIGSHDNRRDSYCGADIHIWSAPTEDLTNWRDEGAVFSYEAPNGLWDTMFAPDLVEVKYRDGSKAYFLYPHSRGPGREALVCKGPTPTGPFTPINLAENGSDLLPGSFIGFDPSVYVEQIDDPTDPDYEIGFRAYVYYGFQKSHAAQLDQSTMWSVRPGTEIMEYFVPSSHSYGNLRDPEGMEYPHVLDKSDYTEFNYFEAKSVRKVGNKYLLMFSGYSGPDYGLESTNSSLRYGYGDSPLGPWKAGGVLVDSRGPVVSRDGSKLETGNDFHNTHGGLECVDGQWYCFYHRPPRGYGFARQAMVAPVKIDWDEQPVSEGGKVTIRAYDPYGDNEIWTAKAGDFEYTGAQVTSEGFNAYGLNPYEYYSAGIAAYMNRTEVLKDNYDIWDDHMPLEGVQNGDRIGYLHFDLRNVQPHTQLNLWLKSHKPCTLNLYLEDELISSMELTKSTSEISKFTVDVASSVENRHKKYGLYVESVGAEGLLFDLIGLGFSSENTEIARPEPPKVAIQIDGKDVEIPTMPTASTIENGLTGFDTYDITVPQAGVITATGPTPVVTENTVTFTYQGRTKTYRIHVAETSHKGEAVEYFIARSNPIYAGNASEWFNDEIHGFTEIGDGVTFTLDVPETGQYEVSLSHDAEGEQVVQQITVGDQNLEFNYRTGGWLTSALSELLHLKAGENTVRIQHLQGKVDLKKMTISKIKGGADHGSI